MPPGPTPPTQGPGPAPTPPPGQMPDPLPAPISPSAAATQLGSGFLIAFTNGPNEAPIDGSLINDIAALSFTTLPLNISDPN